MKKVEEAACTPYPSDLSDAQWALVRHLFEGRKGPRAERGSTATSGRPFAVTMRQAVNGVLYQGHTGVPWRFLPRDIYPHYHTIYNYYTLWDGDGTRALLYGLLNLVLPVRAKGKNAERAKAGRSLSRSRMPRAGHPARSPQRRSKKGATASK